MEPNKEWEEEAVSGTKTAGHREIWCSYKANVKANAKANAKGEAKGEAKGVDIYVQCIWMHVQAVQFFDMFILFVLDQDHATQTAKHANAKHAHANWYI